MLSLFTEEQKTGGKTEGKGGDKDCYNPEKDKGLEEKGRFLVRAGIIEQGQQHGASKGG